MAGEGVTGIFKIPELKNRILFTIGMLFVFRIGSHIPTPGVNSAVLAEFFRSMQGTILGMFDMFTGSNLSQATIFALGIMPYISSSIIIQLLTVVVPTLEKLKKEGEAGQRVITKYTRFGTVILASIQGLGISFWLESLQPSEGMLVVTEPGWTFRIMTVITLAAGTAFLMWLGEQITERGIGNGISLIIFAGIVADLPVAIIQTFQKISIGELNAVIMVGLLVMMLAVIAAIIFLETSQRRIPIHHAKRQVGRRQYAGPQTHLPLKLNTSGVIPPIFASSLIMVPGTIAQFIPAESAPGWLSFVQGFLQPGQLGYEFFYVGMIFFFCFFYTAIIFKPSDVAENLKKSGGFIPGIRPGKPTMDYIDKVLSRITFTGACYLAAVCVIPDVLVAWLSVPFYFGGTGLLIVVGVGMDTLSQIESHLVMRSYDRFVKRGSLRGRR
ncbi:MAG: preprotein translocase subunit SecY [Nitrospinota bacterium]|nr:preprotein translocase subunit SecY [Nitrospinota bacterium]MDH5678063.1 preprotein translocase subunit SecY [Nitrospinota bacterium]MDH5755543.1 preprotein translocase subunit SecY [Nitrospinota bacterium]